MEGPQPESLGRCRNASEGLHYVKKKIELCIQKYMSLEKTAKYLEKAHQISKTLTHSVWEQLRKENPDFFNHFDLRCEMALQKRRFNDMVTQQAFRMFQDGLLDICDASPSVRSLLRPERVHFLEILASKRKQSSTSLALPYANGPSVAQSQNPYHQQDQVLNSASFAMHNPTGSSGDTGHNRPSLAAQLVTQPNEQQNVSVETLQHGGRSYGLVNGESSDHQLCNNLDKNQSKILCTSVDQKQAGKVKRPHPESEDGDGTEQ